MTSTGEDKYYEHFGKYGKKRNNETTENNLNKEATSTANQGKKPEKKQIRTKKRHQPNNKKRHSSKDCKDNKRKSKNMKNYNKN